MTGQFMDGKLRTIDAEGIADAGDEFDHANKMIENALTELVDHFPRNSNASHVLLKVTTINALYYTGILAVQTVANHIYDHCAENRDRALDSGEVQMLLISLR